MTVNRQRAIVTAFDSPSPYRGETEVDLVVTVARPAGLFYLVWIAPKSEGEAVPGVFEEMLRSLQFR